MRFYLVACAGNNGYIQDVLTLAEWNLRFKIVEIEVQKYLSAYSNFKFNLPGILSVYFKKGVAVKKGQPVDDEDEFDLDKIAMYYHFLKLLKSTTNPTSYYMLCNSGFP